MQVSAFRAIFILPETWTMNNHRTLYSALTRTNACGLQYATLRQTTVAVRFDPTALVDDMLLLPVAILITYTFLIRLQI